MAQTTISVRIDDDLKKNFDKICNELEISISSAVVMQAKKMVREKRLPFEVSIDPFYSKENIERLKRSIYEIEKRKERFTILMTKLSRTQFYVLFSFGILLT